MSRPALFSANLKVADAITREYHLPGADRDDVQQEARIALWEATSVYQPFRGTFKTFARVYIHGRLRDRVKAANRPSRLLLTDSVRDQCELYTTDPVEARETLRDLTRLVAVMNAKDRDTIARIANDIPSTGKTDETRRYRVRQKLRRAAA